MIEERTNISSGSPFEEPIGFSRAVRSGNFIAVSGTAPIPQDGGPLPPDTYSQTKLCLTIMKDAIELAGGTLENIIRTRVMLTDISKVERSWTSTWRVLCSYSASLYLCRSQGVY